MNVNWGNLIGISLETVFDCTVGAFTLVVNDIGASIANEILHYNYACLYSCWD